MTKLLLTAFCGLCILASKAQTKEESIKELMKVMKQDSLIDKTFNAILPAMHKQIQNQYGNASQSSEELYKFSMKHTSDMVKRMIDEDMVVVYANLFTQSEISDYISFYKSSSGQKMLTVMPEMQKQLMNIMLTKYMPDLQQKIKQKALELHPKK